jgi:hypothetical protein
MIKTRIAIVFIITVVLLALSNSPSLAIQATTPNSGLNFSK